MRTWRRLALALMFVGMGLACSLEGMGEPAARPIEKSPMGLPEATEIVPPRPLARQDGLAAYYPFAGNAQDMSGNGYHGQVVGAQLAADRMGKAEAAYAFDGVNDYIRLPDYLDLDFTVSAWIEPTDYGALSTTSASCHRAIFSYRYRAHKDGALENSGLFASLLEMNGCDGNEQLGGAFIGSDFGYNTLYWPFGRKEWFLYTLTRQENLLVLYVDGQAVMEKVISQQPGLEAQAQPFTVIGAYLRPDLPGWLFPFQGKIDEVRVYQRALDAREVWELYQEE